MALDFKATFGAGVVGWTSVSALNGSLISYAGNSSYGVDTTGETDVPPDDVFKSFLYVVPAGDPLNFKKTGLTPNELYDFYLYLWHNSGFWSGHSAVVLINGVSVGGYTYNPAVPGKDGQWGHGKVVKFSNIQANSAGELNVSVDPDNNYFGVSGYRIKGLPDTTPPTKVTGLAVTNRVVTSNVASDNVGVEGYQTQYRNDGGAWIDFISNQQTFTDNVARLTSVGDHTRDYRRRAYDAATPPNYGEWSDVFTVNYTVLPPPVIRSMSGLFAKIGNSYQLKLEASGGSGNYIWSQTIGNLPNGALSDSGIITIPVVGDSNYTFTARCLDTVNNSYDEESFTIIVTPFSAIRFCYLRSLEEEEILKQRVFEPVQGDDEVAEDAAPQYQFTLKEMYVGEINLSELREFLTAHRKRQKFLWINPDFNNQALLVKRVDNYKASHALNYGGFEFTVRTINGLTYVG